MKRFISLALIALVLAMAVMPTVAQAQSTGGGFSVPVSGHAKGGGKVSGTFTIHRFVNEGGQLGAFGTLLVRTAGGDTAVTQVVMPVTATHRPEGSSGAGAVIQQVCEILDLVLGPLDLNLLGLEIHLDTVHLVIEANPAGGLLGALLAGLLCGLDLGPIFGDLAALVTFLNNLLALLIGFLGSL